MPTARTASSTHSQLPSSVAITGIAVPASGTLKNIHRDRMGRLGRKKWARLDRVLFLWDYAGLPGKALITTLTGLPERRKTEKINPLF
ncbi:MAG TPA: hypothetical protein VEI95_18030 [Acidobacteriota bacterium]|nr:hypothetical protein [Acidobacteriota bacterium]